MIKDSNIKLQVTITKELNKQLKQIANNKKTSISKLCKEYILKSMKKDLKELNPTPNKNINSTTY